MKHSIVVYRLSLKRERTIRLSDATIPYATIAARVARGELGDSPHERLLGFFVNSQNTIVSMMVLGCASATSAVSGVSTRGVCQAALAANASAIVLAHNHPSGDPTPSVDDERTTRMLETALKVIDVPLLDHVIVTRSERYSSRVESPDVWRQMVGD
jgi:DNA repair protein RadC